MQLTGQPEEQDITSPPGAQLPSWLNSARSVAAGLLRTAYIRRHTAVDDTEADGWSRALEQVIGDLDRLNQQTERDFLSIGGKLTEFIEAVSLISTELTVLGDLISGEHALRASQALTCALKHSTEMGSRHADRNAGLSGMLREAGRLKQTLAGFESTVASIRTLGVLTRIETARLGTAGTDFGSLADDVKALATDVQTRVETALATASLLVPSIESATHSISAMDEGQARDLPAVVSGVLASLTAFRDIQTKARDSSVRMAGQYEAISDAFKKLIVSLQFHDITRQQIEHVIESLRSVRSLFEKGVSQDPRGVVAAVILQSSQLADADRKFAACVASVTHNLDEIARRVREMAEESRILSGLSEDEKNSFFLEMEKGCTAILGGLSNCAEATAASRVASIELAETIARMRGSIEEIQAIEIQMQRMALNAGIRAAHIGPLGDALSVLAGAIQQGALDSRRCSESLVDALAVMSEGATNLFPEQGVETGAGEDEADCVERMRKAVAELHSSSERSFAQITRITALGARLREDISATRSSFSVGSVFADSLGRAREMLAEIRDRRQTGSSLRVDGGLERSLADFARRYTMQAERDVHEGAGKAAAGPAPAKKEEATQSSEELGENVEFF